MHLSSLALAALMAALPMASAQTPACNPLKSDVTCPADKALSTAFAEDFKSESKWFSAATFPDRISYGDDGLKVTLAQRYDNPAIKSNFYIMFGRLEVVMKAAPGRGVVSSFYLQSDDLDEIDLEWIGSDNTEVQTNFFSKGDITTYDRGQFHGVYEPQHTFHNYTIDWTNEALTWYLDGQVLRVLRNDSASGYPQSPMYVMSGVWAGGDPDNAPGTIEWAGGLTDFTQAPFSMQVQKVFVTDYSSGTEYSYGDKTGKWTSIIAKDGAVNGRIQSGQADFALSSQALQIESSSKADTTTTTSSSSSSSFSTSSSSTSTTSSSTSSSSTSTTSSSESSASSQPEQTITDSSTQKSTTEGSSSSEEQPQTTTEQSTTTTEESSKSEESSPEPTASSISQASIASFSAPSTRSSLESVATSSSTAGENSTTLVTSNVSKESASSSSSGAKSSKSDITQQSTSNGYSLKDSSVLGYGVRAMSMSFILCVAVLIVI